MSRLQVGRVRRSITARRFRATVALSHPISLIVTIVEHLIVLLQVGEALSWSRLLSAVPRRITDRCISMVILDRVSIVSRLNRPLLVHHLMVVHLIILFGFTLIIINEAAAEYNLALLLSGYLVDREHVRLISCRGLRFHSVGAAQINIASYLIVVSLLRSRALVMQLESSLSGRLVARLKSLFCCIFL